MQRSLSIPPHCLHAQPITIEAMKEGPGVGHYKKMQDIVRNQICYRVGSGAVNSGAAVLGEAMIRTSAPEPLMHGGP